MELLGIVSIETLFSMTDALHDSDGDKLILESTKISDKRGIWKFECKASVEDEFVCSATILCADRPK